MEPAISSRLVEHLGGLLLGEHVDRRRVYAKTTKARRQRDVLDQERIIVTAHVIVVEHRGHGHNADGNHDHGRQALTEIANRRGLSLDTPADAVVFVHSGAVLRVAFFRCSWRVFVEALLPAQRERAYVAQHPTTESGLYNP
jgi:hypothetical protein